MSRPNIWAGSIVEEFGYQNHQGFRGEIRSAILRGRRACAPVSRSPTTIFLCPGSASMPILQFHAPGSRQHLFYHKMREMRRASVKSPRAEFASNRSSSPALSADRFRKPEKFGRNRGPRRRSDIQTFGLHDEHKDRADSLNAG